MLIGHAHGRPVVRPEGNEARKAEYTLVTTVTFTSSFAPMWQPDAGTDRPKNKRLSLVDQAQPFNALPE